VRPGGDGMNDDTPIMSADEFNEFIRKTKQSKYRNVKTTVDGITFASKREANRYAELKLMKQAGEIIDLVLQIRYPIVVNDVKICTYIADFVYFDVASGRYVVEDAKSKATMTPAYRIKKKLMKAIYDIDIQEV
jgi:hypothetical protein